VGVALGVAVAVSVGVSVGVGVGVGVGVAVGVATGVGVAVDVGNPSHGSPGPGQFPICGWIWMLPPVNVPPSSTLGPRPQAATGSSPLVQHAQSANVLSDSPELGIQMRIR
jgi:hypothetical protein